MRPTLILTILLTFGAAHCTLAAEPSIPQVVRDTLFKDANDALSVANEAQANLLAPTSYGAGAEDYRKAESILADGGDIERIQRNLASATELFRKAAEDSKVARTTFEDVLKTRQEADAAKAPDFAAEQWQEAEQTFGEGAIRLERGRLKSAQKAGEEAKTLYKAAELTAIKANYLATTRSLLQQADDIRAKRYAPESFNRAKALLEEAEVELNENRYDTDRPRNLAQLAEHNAHHAIYVATLENQIRRDETNLEQILLQWEASISELADQLDIPVYFDNGEKDAINALKTRIQTLQADLDFLQQGAADRDAQIAALNLEVGGQSASLQRMNQIVDKQRRQRERIATVEALFTPEQAIVLRQGESVILRMIGLNFATGRSQITSEQYPLLNAVQRAILQFPEASVVIEGHTDSFGSDDLNLRLSQARAEAVLQYLLSNAPLSPANLTALGYGESRPAANNETPEGRKRNRRIDIVIYPVW